jgi:hypothetical protein
MQVLVGVVACRLAALALRANLARHAVSADLIVRGFMRGDWLPRKICVQFGIACFEV